MNFFFPHCSRGLMFAIKTLAGHAPSAGSRKESFLPLPASGGSWCSLACGCILASHVCLHHHMAIALGFLFIYNGYTGTDLGPTLVHYPWRRKWQPTPVFLPEKSHGQRSLADYSPWGHKELDRTEQLSRSPLYSCLLITSAKSLFQIRSHCGITGEVRFGWPLFSSVHGLQNAESKG